MEQKAKRVGKFNIIDIIAVILIVAVVAFGAWKLLGSSGGTAAEDGGMVKVTYVVKLRGCAHGAVRDLPGPSALSADGLRRCWWAARLSAWRWSPTTCWAPMGSGSRIRSM